MENPRSVLNCDLLFIPNSTNRISANIPKKLDEIWKIREMENPKPKEFGIAICGLFPNSPSWQIPWRFISWVGLFPQGD